MKFDTLDKYIYAVLWEVPVSVLSKELRTEHNDFLRELLYQFWYKDVPTYQSIVIVTTFYREYNKNKKVQK